MACGVWRGRALTPVCLSSGLSVALAEQRRQAAERAEHRGGVQFALGRHFAFRRGRVDDVRQNLREQAGDLIRLHAGFCREVGDGLGAEYAVQRIRGDRLVLAGPFQDEDGKPAGSFMVIEAASQAEAEAIYGRDPFIVQGVFGSWEISRWALTINKAAGR